MLSNSVVTCQKDENQQRHHAVLKVQNGACNIYDLKFDEVINCIQLIHSCQTTDEKGSLPPMIML